MEKGEIFGLLGPSGAGKTTPIRILTGQLYLQVNTIPEICPTAETVVIMACNILLITGVFLIVYWKVKQN